MSEENIGSQSIKEQPKGQSENNQNQQQLNLNQQEALQSRKKMHNRKSDISTFIMKTYKILDDKKNSDIVQWADQGNCFIVKNKQRFQTEILPKYFKHRKFSSFVRQLNMYDFHKIRKEKQIPIFKHKYFKMNAIDLLHKIKRKSGEELREQQGSMVNPIQSPIPQNPQRFGSVARSLNIQSQIQILTRQNGQLQQNIAELTHQINTLQLSKDRKKQKLMKIISSMMFFQLKPKNNFQAQSLRKLQEHFIRDQQPWTFPQYSQQLSKIYSYIKNSLQ